MVEVNNVTKSFGIQMVLNNINITCSAGLIYGLIGRNGSGKTVLLKCILGLLTPDKGEVKVNGRRVGKDIDFAESTGFIIERPGFLAQETALTNLKYIASIRRQICKADIIKAISSVGLDPKSKKKVGKYSLGMVQRLGIAQAIMENPDILLLDEPMNGLDNRGVSDIRSIILNLKKEGKTIMLASHNREDIEILCDEVFEVDNGIMKHSITKRK